VHFAVGQQYCNFRVAQAFASFVAAVDFGFIRQDAPTVGAWPTLIAILVTVGLQWRWRHALLSIFAGTGVYVLLRNAPMLF